MSDILDIYRHGDKLSTHRKFIGQFLQMADIRYCDRGELLDSPQGEPMKALHMLVNGIIECSFTSASGQRKITGLLENGTFIGMSALDGYLGHHTFVCRTPSVIASMPVERLKDWSREMLLSLVIMQTEKTRTVGHQILHQYLEPTQVRLARLLLELAGPAREAAGQEIPSIVSIAKQEAADFIGVSREHLTKVMGEMRKNELLTVRGKSIIFYRSRLASLIEK